MATQKQMSNTKYIFREFHSSFRKSPLSAPSMSGFTKEERLLFESYYAKAQLAGDDDRLVQLVDLMLKMMLKAGHAKEKWVHPKSMGVHPSNRGGALMQVAKMYRKGAKIIKVGVSLSRCGPSQAIAFENDPVTNNCRKWITKTVAQAPKHFADFNPAMIEAGSVGCGHWNQFLAAMIDGKEVPAEQNRAALCEKGESCMDSARLCKDQPVLKAILETGLKWTVIGSEMEMQFPKLPHLIQKSLNVEHHIGEGIYQTTIVSFCLRSFHVRPHADKADQLSFDRRVVGRAVRPSR
jgi:hypothetical protein